MKDPVSMSTAWDYCNPVRIVFGAGKLATLPELVSTSSVLLITTSGFTRRGTTARVREMFGSRTVVVLDTVEPNPDVDFLETQAAGLAGQFGGTIVALGGGSVIDTGKILGFALAAAKHGFSIRNYVDGQTALPKIASLPVVAIPTTAGTGSEVTPFATLWERRTGAKHSLATPQLFPGIALLDPELTLELPREITIATGLDAISQALESIWNRNANPLTANFSLRALAGGLPALRQLLDDPRNREAREQMMLASLLAGMAISRTRTALAHSMSYPLTARYGVPHGLACSFTLPAILRFNGVVDDGRLSSAAKQLGFAGISQLADALESLLAACGLDRLLADCGLNGTRLEAVLSEMIHPGRADNNLRPADFPDLRMILAEASGYLPGLRS